MTRSEKILCVVYGVIAFSALIATWSNNIAFFNLPANGGLMGFLNAIYSNPAAASFANDLLLYAVAGSIFMVIEAQRLGIRHVWVYLVLSLAVAVSVMFPVFLIVRQVRISQMRQGMDKT